MAPSPVPAATRSVPRQCPTLPTHRVQASPMLPAPTRSPASALSCGQRYVYTGFFLAVLQRARCPSWSPVTHCERRRVFGAANGD